jgi:hypothetical protein
MTKQECIKSEYNEISHYDLAMSLLCDYFTDDLKELIEICTIYFNQENIQEVESAWNDYHI